MGRPRSPNPRKCQVVFKVTPQTKREYESLRQKIKNRRKIAFEEDILKFMIQCTYQSMG